MVYRNRKHVDDGSAIITDEAGVYGNLSDEFASHETVNHMQKEYSRGNVTTNTVEGFFNLLKRGVYGSFHHISEKDVHRYLSEFDFRYNGRKISDGARTELAIYGFEGKRLKYRD